MRGRAVRCVEPVFCETVPQIQTYEVMAPLLCCDPTQVSGQRLLLLHSPPLPFLETCERATIMHYVLRCFQEKEAAASAALHAMCDPM